MNLAPTAATPTSAAIRVAPRAAASTQPTTATGGGLSDLSSRFPMKAVIGGVLGAGLGFLLLGPLGALAGGALGAFIGARMAAQSPRQS